MYQAVLVLRSRADVLELRMLQEGPTERVIECVCVGGGVLSGGGGTYCYFK